MGPAEEGSEGAWDCVLLMGRGGVAECLLAQIWAQTRARPRPGPRALWAGRLGALGADARLSDTTLGHCQISAGNPYLHTISNHMEKTSAASLPEPR